MCGRPILGALLFLCQGRRPAIANEPPPGRPGFQPRPKPSHPKNRKIVYAAQPAPDKRH